MDHRELPIYELEHELVAALRSETRLILQAPTGSGKSTQVPQMLLDHGLLGAGQVVVLQPRRLAARMLAARVALERDAELGGEVGYQIRFEKVTSARTRIRFVTEGVLLRQMLEDPALRGITAVIFDEFHERHLYGDITLARSLQAQSETRPDLRILVMSATLDQSKLEPYLAPCRVLTSRGRTHPVAIEYLETSYRHDEHPVWDLAATELERAASATEGDVLIFMPGAYEIGRTMEAVRHSSVGGDFLVLPLHGELPPGEQDRAVARASRRKVIVSTNVAETSLTIDGVTLVIDSGLARIARFDPHRGINTLLVEKISQAAADQRAGRAGRTAPGRCVRLWTERSHHERAGQELPEVKRLDLAEVVLTLKASGVADVRRFRWLEAPEPLALARAEALLTDLGALEKEASAITDIGRRMLAFPVHPRYARMFLAAHELGCVRSIALVAALTQGRNLLRRSDGKVMTQDREDLLGESAGSDFFILIRAWQFAQRNDGQRCRRLGINTIAAREAGKLFDQFLHIAREEGLDVERDDGGEEAIQRCLLVGFSDQLALRLDTGTLRCALVHGRRGLLARESVVHESHLLVASEVREIERGGEVEVLLTLNTGIREEWLREMLPGDFTNTAEARLETTLRRVVARRETRFRDLVLRSEQTDDVALEAAASLLARAVVAGEFPLKLWDHAVDQWIERVNFLATAFPEYAIPPLRAGDRLSIIEQICYGARSYREIKERPVWPAVRSWLSPGQHDLLERFAPERLELPNGRKAKVAYAENAAPTIAVRIQDLYGVEQSLALGGGRVPVVIQVLAPNHRPIQITQNLASFWREAYPKLKQELQRKYPKHEWR